MESRKNHIDYAAERLNHQTSLEPSTSEVFHILLGFLRYYNEANGTDIQEGEVLALFFSKYPNKRPPKCSVDCHVNDKKETRILFRSYDIHYIGALLELVATNSIEWAQDEGLRVVYNGAHVIKADGGSQHAGAYYRFNPEYIDPTNPNGLYIFNALNTPREVVSANWKQDVASAQVELDIVLADNTTIHFFLNPYCYQDAGE